MAQAAADAFFTAAGTKPFRFEWEIQGAVPRSRGLGSSVTVRLGLLHGLNKLAGDPLSRKALFEICARLEGHPDNAAPAAFGGFVASAGTERFARFPISPKLKFIVLIPDFELETSAARKVLPATVAHKDAAANAARTSLLVAAFASQNYKLLKNGFEDVLHQPYRTKLLPQLPTVIQAGTTAGALGGFLSGSGSSIACVTLSNSGKIARRMKEAFGPGSADIVITEADNLGARVLSLS